MTRLCFSFKFKIQVRFGSKENVIVKTAEKALPKIPPRVPNNTPTHLIPSTDNPVPSSILTPQIIAEQQLQLNKALILKFSEHFHDYKLETLLDDYTFIDIMHNAINKAPTQHSRSLQLNYEVTYSRRLFKQDTLQKYYVSTMNVQDTFNVNNGVCDQSTVFSSVLTNYFCYYFNIDKKDIILATTPLYPIKITDSLTAIMAFNKHMTSNTAPDFYHKGSPYDHKETKNISYGKNHISFIDPEDFIKSGAKYVLLLESSLRSSLAQTNDEDIKMYTRDILSILENKITIHPQKKLDAIYHFVLNKQPPIGFKMPYIIVKNKAKFEDFVPQYPPEKLEKVPLDPGTLEYNNTKKAMMGILKDFANEEKDKIQKATNNSIVFTKTNASEPPSSEIVD